MNIITRTIKVTNTGSINDNVKVTLLVPSGVSISSFTPVTGTFIGNVWTISKMYDGETVKAVVNLLVPNNYYGKMTVNVFGKNEEVDISDNTKNSTLQTPEQVSCAPPNAECGQPTVSLLESMSFGMIEGNMAEKSCLSTHCLHRFSVSDLINVSNFEYNKANGDFSLQPTNPFLPWSFNFRVKSYDCTVTIKGKTQFEPDGPKTISGPALYAPQHFIDALTSALDIYDTAEDADADTDLVEGEWFVVKDDVYTDQGTIKVKL